MCKGVSSDHISHFWARNNPQAIRESGYQVCFTVKSGHLSQGAVSLSGRVATHIHRNISENISESMSLWGTCISRGTKIPHNARQRSSSGWTRCMSPSITGSQSPVSPVVSRSKGPGLRRPSHGYRWFRGNNWIYYSVLENILRGTLPSALKQMTTASKTYYNYKAAIEWSYDTMRYLTVMF